MTVRSDGLSARVKIGIGIAVFGLLVGLVSVWATSPSPVRGLVLLLPDDASAQLPAAHAWVDAAREEGVPIVVATDDEFLRFGGEQSFAGVILPDTVHRQASDLLLRHLQTYVAQGGKLLIGFDAGVLDSQSGGYSQQRSRLSQLAGVEYGLYTELRGKTTGRGAIFGSPESERELGLQPGKLDHRHSAKPGAGELTTYSYRNLHHDYFKTGKSLGARALLTAADGSVIVGHNRMGKGEVLFANLPLGYLKTRTDSYLLHRLLTHFAQEIVQLPRLLAVPEGRGGLVLNLHIDSNAAQAPLLQLEQAGWFRDGPFSMHVTAGPDTYNVGDGAGLRMDDNVVMQEFFKRQAAHGHEMGNHGGWIHDVFGNGANESSRERFEPWLEANQKTMTKVLGKPMRVYSAPQGNQPTWATRWLERNDFKAYYFTGDNGLGPTRSYYEGKRPAPKLWAFPVSNLLKIATFEELDDPEQPVSAADIQKCLIDLANYAADHRVARLFYFHPPAAPRYSAVMEGLSAESRRLAAQGRFRWYTMEALADFMTRREQTDWRVEGSEQGASITANNPKGLRDLTWTVPVTQASKVSVTRGKASVTREGEYWLVRAQEGTTLSVELRR